MTTTATRIDDLDRIQRGEEARRLGRAAYDALLDLLDDLDPDEWQQPTVCEPWTVADMVGHVIGSAKAQASVLETIRTQVWALLHKGEYDSNMLDAWTDLTVQEQADLSPQQRIGELRQVAPKAVAGREKVPALFSGIPIPIDQSGSTPDGAPSKITVGDLNTVIYTRDTWLHRIDIVRATDRTPALERAVDGRIVEDVVVEWARRHRRPFRLELTGPAGGSYVQGDGGPNMELDAVEFAWILSGRGEPDPSMPGADLLRTRVLF